MRQRLGKVLSFGADAQQAVTPFRIIRQLRGHPAYGGGIRGSAGHGRRFGVAPLPGAVQSLQALRRVFPATARPRREGLEAALQDLTQSLRPCRPPSTPLRRSRHFPGPRSRRLRQARAKILSFQPVARKLTAEWRAALGRYLSLRGSTRGPQKRAGRGPPSPHPAGKAAEGLSTSGAESTFSMECEWIFLFLREKFRGLSPPLLTCAEPQLCNRHPISLSLRDAVRGRRGRIFGTPSPGATGPAIRPPECHASPRRSFRRRFGRGPPA